MKSYLAVFWAVHIPWGISHIPQGIMLPPPVELWCFFEGAQDGNYMPWAYSWALWFVPLPFGDLQLKVKIYLVISYHYVSSTTKDVYFMPKLCTRLRRKFFISQGFYRSWKSKKFICQAWIVMEFDWPPRKLLVNENSVIEIRYCRFQSKEIACMIEMSNHGTNLIEKQSLCLFNTDLC